MSYRRDGDTVTLTMNADQYDMLMICVGYAVAAADRASKGDLRRAFARLCNDINEGNDNYNLIRP